MKKLLRRLSRVSSEDSSSAALLGQDKRARWWRRRLFSLLGARKQPGYLPVRVGEEGRRLVVRLELVNHPAFAELLNASAEAYGYGQYCGALRVACSVHAFELLLAAFEAAVVHPVNAQGAAGSLAADGCEVVS